jgi:G3E family GTPase
MINEFGAIDIDSRLIVGETDGIMALRNGCVCCTVGDDFEGALAALVRRRPQPEAIVLETTGIADPLPLVEKLTAKNRRDVELEAVVTVDDGEQVQHQHKRSEVVDYQIAFADFLVLNKTDLIGMASEQQVRSFLRDINPHAPIVRAPLSPADLDMLFGAHSFGMAQSASHEQRYAPDRMTRPQHQPHQTDPNHRFTSASYRGSRPLDLHALERWLDALPPDVMRGKGFLWVAGYERKVVVHIVGARRELTEGEPWGREQPTSELVLIGTGWAPLRNDIIAKLEACEQAERLPRLG